MLIPQLEGTTLRERIALVFEADPADSVEAARLLDVLIDWERLNGEFGTTLAVIGDEGDAQHWLTTVIVASVFTSSINHAENGVPVGDMFVDEWLMRGYGQSISELIGLSIPAEATREERQDAVAAVWSQPMPDFRTFLQAALFRELLQGVERFPGILPRQGILSEALAA